MAASPLTNTPTDIMYMIFDLLPVHHDLCNFRLVCRWAQQQSHECFASRAYRYIHISIEKGSMLAVQRAERVFRENTAFAAYVRTLSIEWSPNTFNPYTQKPCFEDVNYFTDHPSVVPTFFQLKKLELHGLTSLYFNDNVRLHSASSVDIGSPSFDALGADWPRLEALSIKHTYLTSEQLVAIVRRAGPALTELHLEEVHTFDGYWIDTIRALYSFATRLENLKLRNLHREPKNWKRCDQAHHFTFRDWEVDPVDKSWEGIDQRVTLAIRRREATMQGAEAVKLGIDMIEDYAATQEQYDW
ncbi:hypothetical protein LTR17_015472 [Elasticomyces elasticus]|nr:hypothetical protein LTR17_015472 [Elasticomyces elasticus]